MALPEERGAVSTADRRFLAEQMETLAHAFPKIIPGWWSSVVPARVIYRSHSAALVIEKTI